MTDTSYKEYPKPKNKKGALDLASQSSYVHDSDNIEHTDLGGYF